MKWKADPSMADYYLERDKDWVEYLNGKKVNVFQEAGIDYDSRKNATAAYLYRNTTMYITLTQYKAYLYDCANYTRILDSYNGQWLYYDNYSPFGIYNLTITIFKF